MIKNSQRRKSTRRVSALRRRTSELAHWQGLAGSHADNKEYASKVEIAQADVDNLEKKVSRFS